MKGPGPVKSMAPFWNKLTLIGQKEGSVKLRDLAQEMGLGEQETLGYLRQVFPGGVGAEIYQHENECWVDINANSIQYMLPLSPSEWIELHQLLVSSSDSNGLTALRKKVTENGPIKVVMEMLSQIETMEHQISEHQQDMINELDQAISLKNAVQITIQEGKCYVVFPCKVLHLEGRLSLIAEDSHDHCLTVIAVSDLANVQSVPEGWATTKVSCFEVEEFITAIRSMNEKETRLILKIHDPQSVNLFPDYQFLGKPCMITNPNGDLIWAAYVEPCGPLYDWLMSLGRNVEILDPVKFKQEYLNYCEEKVLKIA